MYPCEFFHVAPAIQTRLLPAHNPTPCGLFPFLARVLKMDSQLLAPTIKIGAESATSDHLQNDVSLIEKTSHMGLHTTQEAAARTKRVQRVGTVLCRNGSHAVNCRDQAPVRHKLTWSLHMAYVYLCGLCTYGR